MALLEDAEKSELSPPESPGILMVEPSKIHVSKFDCEILRGPNFIEEGKEITIEVLPIELGNKLILHTGMEKSDRVEIKISQIARIGSSEKQNIFMNNTKLFVEILLKNGTTIMVDFLDNKADDFILLVDGLSKLEKHYWKFSEIKCNRDYDFKKTKLYYQTPFLARGEELLWSHEGNEGVFDNQINLLMCLTNLRILIYYFDTHECTSALLSQIDDILVMNSHSIPDSTELESFSSTELSILRGGSKNKKKIKNQTKGDVIFMNAGEKLISFVQMDNPNAFAEFAKSLKNNIIVQDKSNFLNSHPNSNYVEQLEDYMSKSNWPQAEKLADLILHKNPDDLIALRSKLGVYLQKQNWEKILEISEHMLSLDPKNFDARIELPAALFNLKELDKAKNAIQDSLDIYPDIQQLLSIKRQIDDSVNSSN